MDINKLNKELRNWEKNNSPKKHYQILMKRRFGRGENATFKYHNFDDGIDYETIEEAVNGKPSLLIVKDAGNYTYHLPKTMDVNGVAVNLFYTTKSEVYFSVYENVILDIDREEISLMAVEMVMLNCRVPSDGEIRELIRTNSFYVDRDKVIYSKVNSYYGYNYDAHYGDFVSGTYKSFYLFSFWNMDNFNSFEYQNKDLDLFSVCEKMGWGIVNLGGNNLRIMDCSWAFSEFLKYKEPCHKDGPKQKHIDYLVSLPLEEVKVVDKEQFANICKVENGDIPTVCFRTFMTLPSGSYYEGARIYIEPKGKVTACKKTNFGEWVNVSLSLNNHHFSYYTNYVNKSALKGTMLEYLIPMLEETDKDSIGAILAATLRHPCIEMLYKSEFRYLIDQASSHNYNNIWEEVTNVLGNINEKSKSLYTMVGFNKKQIAYIQESTQKIIKTFPENSYTRRFKKYDNLYKIVKKAFATSFMNDIDFDSFKKVVDVIVDIEIWINTENKKFVFSDGTETNIYADYYGKCYSVMNIISKNWSIVTLVSMAEKIRDLYIYREEEPTKLSKFVFEDGKNGYKWVEYDGFKLKEYFTLYYDYITMLDDVDDKAGLTPHFQNYEHIKIMHDEILPVYVYYQNLKKAAADAAKLAEEKAKWDKRINFWKKWEYSNDTYTIVIPLKPTDLTAEGASLGHCVGRYIDRVLNKTTNIVFIRAKDEPEKSLFTVEVSNEGFIEQIHGRGNSNITDENVVKEHPTIGKFVTEWTEAVELRTTNYNKVR